MWFHLFKIIFNYKYAIKKTTLLIITKKQHQIYPATEKKSFHFFFNYRNDYDIVV